MKAAYGRDLDLNLLRVFVVVVETGSATAAASRLYLTQPAISAALKRLAGAVGGPLFAREGRGLVLTARGERLFEAARPHLTALVEAALAPEAFDPRTSERTLHLGLSDANDEWLLPPLVRALAAEAPRMRLVILPVQFRTVGEALSARRVDLAVTVADELPAGVERQTLFVGDFVALHDPRVLRLPKTLSLERYLEHEHVVVSYNADLRGIVEDLFGVERRARLSIPSFHGIGALVEGSTLLATVPALLAAQIRRTRPRLRAVKLAFRLGGAPLELLWRSALGDDQAVRLVRSLIVRLAERGLREGLTRPRPTRGGG